MGRPKDISSGFMICTVCKISKPLADFNKSICTKYGYMPRCKKCCSEYYHKRKQGNPDWYKDVRANAKKRMSDGRRNPLGWARQHCNVLKCRTPKWGLEFNLTADYILSLFSSDLCCPVFHKPFVFGTRGPMNPSIDRLDSTKGYVVGNIRIISWRANTIKSNASVEELRSVAFWLDKELTAVV